MKREINKRHSYVCLSYTLKFSLSNLLWHITRRSRHNQVYLNNKKPPAVLLINVFLVKNHSLLLVIILITLFFYSKMATNLYDFLRFFFLFYSFVFFFSVKQWKNEISSIILGNIYCFIIYQQNSIVYMCISFIYKSFGLFIISNKKKKWFVELSTMLNFV